MSDTRKVLDVFDRMTALYLDENLLLGKEFDALMRHIEDKQQKQKQNWNLYVIGCLEVPNVVKIGVARNVLKRLKMFQTGHFYKLCILRVIHVGSIECAFHMEMVLHRYFKPFSASGEWFTLPEQILQQLIHDTIYRFHSENPFERPSDEYVKQWVERVLSEGPKTLWNRCKFQHYSE